MTPAGYMQRMQGLTRSKGKCEVCGKELVEMQGAHRIANTKTNRERYGSFVIDHVKNIAIVCSLKCNDACNIGNRPGEVMKLIASIYGAEAIKYEC